VVFDPDIEVETKPEDFALGRDVQVDKAIEIHFLSYNILLSTKYSEILLNYRKVHIVLDMGFISSDSLFTY
jgi:hypothetical protein